jgi:hypothetical protein
MPRREEKNQSPVTIKHMDEEEIISVYTKEQAIDDGFLFQAGKFWGLGIVFTENLIARLSKESLLMALLQGLEAAGNFTGPDIATIQVGDTRVWVDYAGKDLTFMLPEDY